METEYCRYILTKCTEKTGTSCIINNEYQTKEDFIKSVDKALLVLLDKKNFRMKETDLLFLLLDFFLSEEKVLFGGQADKKMSDYIKDTREKYQLAKQKWIQNKKQVSQEIYDLLFETISAYLIIMENARICIVENKEEEISFITATVDIVELDKALSEVNRYFPEEKKKLLSFSGMNIKGLIKKTWVDFSINQKYGYFYFYFIMHATYTRNKELEEEIGYGW